MKTVGIIAEFNPFHNGHKYLIEEAKKITGADKVVVVMSGNFVQRGEPAIFNKYLRTKMAIANGADLVIELPFIYSTSSAEYFAKGAVSLLDKLGCIDFLCFGSESGEISALDEIADILLNETDNFKSVLNSCLKNGFSFPESRMSAVLSEISEDKQNAAKSILEASNNILGIEYIKALKEFKSPIKPIAIKRVGDAYNDEKVSDNFSSATALRGLLNEDDFAEKLKGNVPENVYDLIIKNKDICAPVFLDDFSLCLGAKLISATSPEELSEYQDVGADLGNKIFKNINEYKSFSQFVDLLNSKDTTKSSISRALMHIMLDIKTIYVHQASINGYHYYVRVLGFNKESGAPILTAIKENLGDTQLITKMADCKITLSLEGNIQVDNLYRMVTMNKFNSALPNEFNSSIETI